MRLGHYILIGQTPVPEEVTDIMERCSTWLEAEQQHKRIVEKILALKESQR